MKTMTINRPIVNKRMWSHHVGYQVITQTEGRMMPDEAYIYSERHHNVKQAIDANINSCVGVGYSKKREQLIRIRNQLIQWGMYKE